MTDEFGHIGGVRKLANGIIGKELCFTYTEALQVAEICTEKRIAILGVEIFQVMNSGFQAKGSSDYEVQQQDWSTFVERNNALAKEFLRDNATGDEHVYVFTTSSENEFRQLEAR